MSDFICTWAQIANEMHNLSLIEGKTCQEWCKNSLQKIGYEISTVTDVAKTIGTGALVAAVSVINAFMPDEKEREEQIPPQQKRS